MQKCINVNNKQITTCDENRCGLLFINVNNLLTPYLYYQKQDLFKNIFVYFGFLFFLNKNFKIKTTCFHNNVALTDIP